MSKHLVVVHPFGDYGRGDEITGEDVAKVLETHRHHVVPVEREDAKPAKTPAKDA